MKVKVKSLFLASNVCLPILAVIPMVSCATNFQQSNQSVIEAWNSALLYQTSINQINLPINLNQDWSQISQAFFQTLINFTFVAGYDLQPVAKMVDQNLVLGLQLNQQVLPKTYHLKIIDFQDQSDLTLISSSWNQLNLVIINDRDQVLDHLLPISASAFLSANSNPNHYFEKSFLKWTEQLKLVNQSAWNFRLKSEIVNHQIVVHLNIIYQNLPINAPVNLQAKSFNYFQRQKDYQDQVSKYYQSIGRYWDLKTTENLNPDWIPFASSISNRQNLHQFLKAFQQDVTIFEQQDFNLKIKLNNNDQVGLINAEFILVEPFTNLNIVAQNLIRVLTINGFKIIDNPDHLKAIANWYQKFQKLNLITDQAHQNYPSQINAQIDLNWLITNTDWNHQDFDQNQWQIRFFNDQIINDDQLGIKAIKIQLLVKVANQWLPVGKPILNQDGTFSSSSQIDNYLLIGNYRTISEQLASEIYQKFADIKIIEAPINQVVFDQIIQLNQDQAMQQLEAAKWFNSQYQNILGSALYQQLDYWKLNWQWNEHRQFNAQIINGKISALLSEPTQLKLSPSVNPSDQIYFPNYDQNGKLLALPKVVFKLNLSIAPINHH